MLSSGVFSNMLVAGGWRGWLPGVGCDMLVAGVGGDGCLVSVATCWWLVEEGRSYSSLVEEGRSYSSHGIFS